MKIFLDFWCSRKKKKKKEEEDWILMKKEKEAVRAPSRLQEGKP